MELSYKRSLKFLDFKGHLSKIQLNEAYGSYGRTFQSRKEAEDFLKTIGKKARIYVLRNYHACDVIKDGYKTPTIKAGAKPHITGYLVTIEHSVKDKYRGY